MSANNSGEFMSMLTYCEPGAQCEQKSTAIAMLQREVVELRSKVDRKLNSFAYLIWSLLLDKSDVFMKTSE